MGAGLVLDGLLVWARLGPAARIPLALVMGALFAPLAGIVLGTPATAAVVAAALALTALRMSSGDAQEPSADSVRRSHRIGTARRGAALWLAWIAIGGGAVAAIYAATGAFWSPAAHDGTEAMSQGITIALVSAIPLLAAVGAISTSGRRWAVWVPIGFAAGAAMLAAAAYTAAPAWDAMAPWMAAAAASGGLATAWWTVSRLRGPRVGRVSAGVAIGVASAAIIWMPLLPLLAFAVPVLGVIVVVRAQRAAVR